MLLAVSPYHAAAGPDGVTRRLIALAVLTSFAALNTAIATLSAIARFATSTVAHCAPTVTHHTALPATGAGRDLRCGCGKPPEVHGGGQAWRRRSDPRAIRSGCTSAAHPRKTTPLNTASRALSDDELTSPLAGNSAAGFAYVLEGEPLRVEGGCNVSLVGAADGAIITRGQERGRLVEVRDSNLELRNVRLEGGWAQVEKTTVH